MTRAMFAQVLANLENINNTDVPVFTASSFNDVSVNAWYFEAIEWASQMGIVQGVAEGEVPWNRPINIIVRLVDSV